ncbi:MAG: hypothetical protein KDI65_11535 [Alphaproteobacteria bacterium]|nr:hypothetical protein [Alphaproteobacteria bacterium]
MEKPKFLADLLGSLRQRFGLSSGDDAQKPEEPEYVEVLREDLTAFVTAQSYGGVQKKIGKDHMARLWENQAAAFSQAIDKPGQRGEFAKGSQIVNAMRNIALEIRNSQEFVPVIKIPREEIERLAGSREALATLQMMDELIMRENAEIIPTRKREPPPDHMHLAEIRLTPYIRDDEEAFYIVPRETLEDIFEPVLIDMKINPTDTHALSMGAEKLGESLIEAYKPTAHEPNLYDENFADNRHTGAYLLKMNFCELAARMRKAGPDAENIFIPQRLMSAIEFKLHHMRDAFTHLQRKQERYPSEEQGTRLAYMTQAYAGIRHRFAQYFEQPGSHPGDTMTFGGT